MTQHINEDEYLYDDLRVPTPMSTNDETRSRREVLKSALLVRDSATIFGSASAAEEPTV